MYPIAKNINNTLAAIVENANTSEFWINGFCHDAVTLTPKANRNIRNPANFSANQYGSDVWSQNGSIRLNQRVVTSSAADTNGPEYSDVLNPQGWYNMVGSIQVSGEGSRYFHIPNNLDVQFYNEATMSLYRTQTHTAGTDGTGYHKIVYDFPFWFDGIGAYCIRYCSVNSVTNYVYSPSGAAMVSNPFFSRYAVVYENSSDVYLFYIVSSSGTYTSGTNSLYQKKFNKTTKAFTDTAMSYTVSGASCLSHSMSRPLTVGSKVHVFYTGPVDGTIVRMTFDTVALSSVSTAISVDWSNNGGNNAFVGLTQNSNSRIVTVIINGGTHLAQIVINRNVIGLAGVTDASCYIYVYEIVGGDPANGLKYTGRTSLGGLLCGGVVDWSSGSGTRLAFLTPSDVRTFTFNATTKVYDTSTTYPVTPMSIGVDFLNRLWIQDFNRNLYMVQSGQTTTVKVSMADASYNYSGSNISTSCNVYALNDVGAKVAKQIKMVITAGSAIFTSNGQTSITVTTNAGSDLNVPVTITGAGRFSILATETL